MSKPLSVLTARLTNRSPIAPVQWRAPAPPERARRSAGTHAFPAVRRIPLPGKGPEDVLVDDTGRVLAGLDDGRIVRVSTDSGAVETVASTGGRPQGLEWDGDGRLIVCDPHRGLLKVDPTSGAIEVLADEVAGIRMRFCNNAAVAADGTIYFSDSSQRFGLDQYMAEVLEHSGTGRLLRLTPGGKPEVLLENLQLANGVALSADGSYVAVAETLAYRVTRLWLDGPRAGKTDIFLDNLPGIPDNLSTGSDGLIWVALATPRNRSLDRLLGLPGALRQVVYAVPEQLQPKPSKTLWVMAVDDDGDVRYDLQGDGRIHSMVTGVREESGVVYLGSLDEPTLATIDISHLRPLAH